MKHMKKKFLGVLITLFIVAVSCNANSNSTAAASVGTAISGKTVYDFTMKDIDGNYISIPYTLTLATQNDQAERLIIKNALDRWTVAQTIGTQIFSNFG